MSSAMYKMKSYHESTEQNSKVELPGVMYKVKNYHESSNDPTAVDTSNMGPVASLELRQEAILTKLTGLRQTLDLLKGRYQVSETPSSIKPVGKMPTQSVSTGVTKSPLGSGIHDIVVNADPSSPPLSLFVLFEMLKQKFSMLATSYVHSSVKNVDPRLSDVIKTGCQVTRGNHQLALSVVWKKVDNGPELVVSPAKQSVITGEVNIARYINRILNPSFDVEDIRMATTIDEWLDTADVQVFNGNSKQKNGTVKSLNVHFKKNAWVVGSEFSLVDAVMWSALHQANLASGATEPVQKWLDRCRELSCFSSLVTIMS